MSDDPSTATNNNMEQIVARKKALRQKIRARIKTLDQTTILQESNQVWERLFALPQYQAAKSVGLFLSMPTGEIHTDPALAHALHHGKKIYVPQVGKNFELADMELVQVILDDNAQNKAQEEIFHASWPRNKWKIPEPPASMPIVTAQPGDIDVLVVPGLAFDQNGDRLGQGKGYYDRFIERMCADDAKKPPFLVAVGLTAQLVVDENIPVAPYDRRMDMVLLPHELITVVPK